MATFQNQATLTYNGNTTTSNIVTGEILETISATKTAVSTSYNTGDNVTYVISLVNTGDTPYQNLTITDNLGSQTVGTVTTVPLDYVTNSILYYNNGTIQATPTVTAENPLTVTGITVPANGNATLIYQASVNSFANPEAGGTVTNTASITGTSLTAPLSASEAITASEEPNLSISKSVSPATVNENGTLTYTFLIQNTGSGEADAGDNITVSDTFNPILNNLTVTLNGDRLAATNYTYDQTTGQFTTTPGTITVPAATYTLNETTGEYQTTPGTSTLVVTGTL